MSELLAQRPKFGDSNNTLLLKIATMFAAGNGLWRPSDIANLEVFAWFKAGNCFSSAYPTETLAGVGDSVQWVKPLYGTTNYLFETVTPPKLRADGLEIDSGGAQRLTLATPLDMASCTIYAVADRPTGLEDFVLTSEIGGPSYLLYIGTDWFWSDTVGGNGSGARTNDLGELFYLGNDNGTWSYEVTGTVGSSAGTGASNLGVEEIGYSTANTVGTNPDCRQRLLIVVSRYIALGSAEDLKIRNWILSNLSAELYGNSYVGPNGEHYYQPDGIHYYLHP